MKQTKKIKKKNLNMKKKCYNLKLMIKPIKIEVALRELNEIRANDGKDEANLDQVAEDPKQNYIMKLKI